MSVEIKSIKTYYCPVCGCREIVEERIEIFNGEIRVHSNGGRWEHRRFACGFQIQYIPNFGKEYTETKCRFDPGELAKREQEKQTKADVMNQIETANCPEEFKNRLRYAIQYL